MFNALFKIIIIIILKKEKEKEVDKKINKINKTTKKPWKNNYLENKILVCEGSL